MFIRAWTLYVVCRTFLLVPEVFCAAAAKAEACRCLWNYRWFFLFFAFFWSFLAPFLNLLPFVAVHRVSRILVLAEDGLRAY